MARSSYPGTWSALITLAAGATIAGVLTLTGATITGHLTPTTDNTYDLGTSSATWRTLYAKTSAILGGGTSAAVLRFLEPSASGTNYTEMKAQAQAGNVTYTLPAAGATVAGQVLTDASANGTLSWATPSGGMAGPGSSTDGGLVVFNGTGGSTAADYGLTPADIQTQNTFLNSGSSGRSMTAAALPASTYNNGTAGVGATITGNANGALVVDGQTVTVNSKMLVKDQVAAAENGLYTVTTVGTGSVPFVLTRTTDNDQATEFYRKSYIAYSGTANADKICTSTAPATITVGTTAVNFSCYDPFITSNFKDTGSGNIPYFVGDSAKVLGNSGFNYNSLLALNNTGIFSNLDNLQFLGNASGGSATVVAIGFGRGFNSDSSTTPDSVYSANDQTSLSMAYQISAIDGSAPGFSTLMTTDSGTPSAVTTLKLYDTADTSTSTLDPSLIRVGDIINLTQPYNIPNTTNPYTNAALYRVLSTSTATNVITLSVDYISGVGDPVVEFGSVNLTVVPQSVPTLEVSFTGPLNGDLVDQAFFIANRAYRVTGVREVHAVASSGAANIQLTKDTSTNAPGAGTDLLTDNTNAGFDLNATANTVQTGTLTATVADLTLAAGDRLSVDFASSPAGASGDVVTVQLIPID